MAKVKKIKTPKSKSPNKKRSSNYEPKLKFTGTFEEIISISATGAGTKKRITTKK